MTLIQMIIGWFYYGVIYMGLSIFATFMLNKVIKRWYLPPLIINAVAILLLLFSSAVNLLPEDGFTFSVYFVYMPIVVASFTFNGVREIFKRIKNN